ncbi:MAG: hypothetical protein JXR59_08910 [Desulfuromonadaceae bacterium]|nr:hypothetical protein [Desulfuromonadaceae bacterium]
MKKLAKFLFWLSLFLLVLLAADQLLLRATGLSGFWLDVQRFHHGFRQRLFEAPQRVTPNPAAPPAGRPSAPTIETLIETRSQAPAVDASMRYLYLNEENSIEFASSLEEIPPRYRATAQRLKE